MYDVMLHDPGPALVAIGQGLVAPYPVADSTQYADLIPTANIADHRPSLGREVRGHRGPHAAEPDETDFTQRPTQ